MSTFESILKNPPVSIQDKRLARLEHIIAQMRKYHPAKRAKRNLIIRKLWDYESLLERIQNKLDKRSI